ncbi:hypothetical protein HN51_024270 [Arachis hypogaea]
METEQTLVVVRTEEMEPRQALVVSGKKVNILPSSWCKMEDGAPCCYKLMSIMMKYMKKICTVGVGADCWKKKTKVIMDKWFPVWEEEFEFPLTVPELALLRIQVKDKDQGKDDFAGQTCLPVSELKLGFRSLPLYDTKGDKFNHVKLLMRFQFQ